MKNLTRAKRKAVKKHFRVGDVVTWGTGCVSHRVVAVVDRGVIVDVTSQPTVESWGSKQEDGRYFLLVLFDSNMQGPGPRCRFREHGVTAGPVRHSDKEPDK